MALTKEDLQAIGALLEPIRADIAIIKEDIAEIKEDTAVTRDTVNGLGEWAEIVAGALKIQYPIPIEE